MRKKQGRWGEGEIEKGKIKRWRKRDREIGKRGTKQRGRKKGRSIKEVDRERNRGTEDRRKECNREKERNKFYSEVHVTLIMLTSI